ncbi:PD40 domain-containing protein [Paenibacillus sp. FJAT-27812]|uniref:PD40 domain-containing protein n=1 Tax=Paenibacillus sp. FJAT-27812 TaxID=1684143 RepID=UPI0006A77F6D|nr:PD40 domain-containing protein [Paenibacillus sp. FJAT-27812]
MKIKLLSVMLTVILIGMMGASGAALAAKRDSSLKAAFVRKGELWLKEGNQEKKLVNGPLVLHPKWSFNGKWLAFAKGEAGQELWVLELRSGRSSLVSAEGGRNFQWAPNAERLAYQTEELLQYVDAKRPDKPLGAAKGIGNYSWLPDGKGFFASSQSELMPDGWTPISLLQIPLAGLSDPSKYVTVHVLPSPSDDFFAVDTSVFKWSADGRWIAFLAKPTASLSADSNTLCVITTDGVVFRTLDEMVSNEQWFEWASSGDRLAYIAGVGREATSNKQLKVIAVTSEKSAEYTPKGYVDQAFAWQGLQHLIVSRAEESKQDAGQSAPANPYLMRVELENGKQTAITRPSGKHGEYNPVALKLKLAWVESDPSTASVIVADANGHHAAEWIKGIDIADSYYGQWRWGEVLAFYGRD